MIVDVVFADYMGTPLTMNSDWYYAFSTQLENGEWSVTVPDNMPNGNYSFTFRMTVNDQSMTSDIQPFTLMLGSDPSSGGGCADSAVITPASSFESMLSFANIPSVTDTKYLPYVTLDDNDCFDWVEVEFVNYDFDGQEVLNSEWANSFIANLNDW